MNPAQTIALRHPCYLAGETLHPRFRHRITSQMSLVLTVNAGYE